MKPREKGYTYSPRSGITTLHRTVFSRSRAVRGTKFPPPRLPNMFMKRDRMRSLRHPDELEKSAQSNVTGVLFRRTVATQDGVLGQLSSTVYSTRLPDDYLENLSRTIRALTADDICSPARRHFGLRQRTNHPGRRRDPNLRPSDLGRPG